MGEKQEGATTAASAAQALASTARTAVASPHRGTEDDIVGAVPDSSGVVCVVLSAVRCRIQKTRPALPYLTQKAHSFFTIAMSPCPQRICRAASSSWNSICGVSAVMHGVNILFTGPMAAHF